MAFQQLYYTSCQSGLAGYGGYQFNAVTPGVSPVVMREVEDRTVYEPPRRLLADPYPDEPEAYPVAFSHGISEATGAALTTHVVFTGADYSGRPGNYFAHALVTGTPEPDFGPVLPVELWGASLWHTSPVDTTELPELAGPLPRGMVDPPGVQAFLDARGAEAVLPELLTAAGQAMAGGQPVLVASQDVAENIWWIAAVCYLLGEHLGRRLSFTTYSHRPGYSRYHLIGVPSDGLPPDADTNFQLFDLSTGQAPGQRIDPLAAILADTGVLAAPGLWQQATVFASGTEAGLDDWLAPVTVAAALLGRRLPPAELDTVTRWLPGAAGWLPAQPTGVALGVVLTQEDRTLADDRLLDLLELARHRRAAARADELESLLAERAITHLARGEPATPVRLTGPAAAAAQARATELLSGTTPITVLAVLDWAAASGVLMPAVELERYGRASLAPDTPEPLLTSILRRSPHVQRGLVARLAEEPPPVTDTLLAGPLGAHLGRDDVADYPELTELWLLHRAAQGSVPPIRAFDDIRDVRAGAGRWPPVDAALLRRLWPTGCPPGQLAELLGIVTSAPERDVLDWFVREIAAAPPREDVKGDWLRVAQALVDHPIRPLLPPDVAHLMWSAARVMPLMRRARWEVSQGNMDIFGELFAVYRAADEDSRHFLDRDLPALLAGAQPLTKALRGCPDGVAAAFGTELDSRLAPQRADVELAARVFAALNSPGVRRQPALSEQLSTAFEQVRTWRRRDISAVARILEAYDLGQSFQKWREEQRTGLARRLFSRDSAPGGSSAPGGAARPPADRPGGEG
jgi:GTPase-associated protein 1, N-terminal domain type 2/GTPase-associated protein 1, C-terminal domain/GTPase-associated protein 1, middle domain